MAPSEFSDLEQRVSALEDELGDFSNIVSHDLAATFRHVASFLVLLREDLGPDLTDRQHDLIARIDTATDNCQAMMEALRAYSRVQRHTLDQSACEASRLFEAAWLELAPRVRESGATIDVGSLGAVEVDQPLMVAALGRLLENAITFRRPDAAPRLEVVAVDDSDDWVAHILDNGVGVDIGQHEKLFRMFHQLDRRAPGVGVGAGLTISRRIFRRHLGDVSFVDRAEGACVEIRLPRTDHLARL